MFATSVAITRVDVVKSRPVDMAASEAIGGISVNRFRRVLGGAPRPPCWEASSSLRPAPARRAPPPPWPRRSCTHPAFPCRGRGRVAQRAEHVGGIELVRLRRDRDATPASRRRGACPLSPHHRRRRIRRPGSELTASTTAASSKPGPRRTTTTAPPTTTRGGRSFRRPRRRYRALTPSLRATA